MAAGKIILQANDGKTLSLVAPEGMVANTSGAVVTTDMLDTKLAITTANETLVKTSDYYAISGQIKKPERTSFFGFTETTPDNLNVSASDWYFKSLNKTVSTIGRSIKFPTAPTGTNLISNGTFDSDTSGWDPLSGATLSIDSGILKITNAAVNGSAYQTIATVVGKRYILECNGVNGTAESYLSARDGVGINGPELSVSQSNGYMRLEFTATSTSTSIRVVAIGGSDTYVYYDNIAVFPATDLLRYDNLLLREDGTYFITQTEQNQYIDMDTMLNYTSNLYSVDTGASTGTSVTFTYNTDTEEYIGSDGKKYITVGSTARFNQGAYHPVFNSCGSKGTTEYFWYSNSATANLVNISSTFNPNYLWGATGRPDSKYYDIIYNELFIDQRWRTEYLDGTKERTTIERDKDISASQYADFVGSATWETIGYFEGLTTTDGISSVYVFAGGRLLSNTYDNINIPALAWNGSKWVKGSYISNTAQEWYFSTSWGANSDTINTNDTYVGGAITKIIIMNKSNLRYGSNTFLHTDILNSFEWDSANTVLAGGGAEIGSPLLVSETGTSMLFNGSTTTFKLSKKVV